MNLKRASLFRSCVLLFVLLVLVASAHADTPLVYQDTTGDKETTYSWSIEQKPGTVTITVEKPDLIFVNRCRENGETLAWSQNGEGSEVQASLQEGVLQVSGVFQGKQMNRTLDLEGLPWLQPLSYSLPKLMERQGPDCLFWTLRPDTLEPVKLKAEFKGRQTLSLNGEQVPAYKIRISPPGILSMFWHGDYWYREKDSLFLQYEGKSGPPGSPMTLVTLLNDPANAEMNPSL